MKPLHRRHAVPSDHLVEFRDVLRAVHRHLETARAGCGEAVAQQLQAAGVHLHGCHHAAEPSGGMTFRPVDDVERVRKIAPAFLEVPGVVQPMPGRHRPLCIAIHWRRDGADACVRQQVEPTVIGHGEIDDGCRAALQKLGNCVLGGRPIGDQLCRRAACLFAQARGHEN